MQNSDHRIDHPADQGPRATGAPSVSRSSERRRTTLVLALVVEMAVAIIVIPPLLRQDPLTYSRIRAAIPQFHSATPKPPAVDYSAALHADLPPGAPLPNDGPGKKMRLADPNSHRKHLVVFVGDCAGCVGVDLGDWEKEAEDNNLSMALLTNANSRTARLFRKAFELKSPVYSDPGRRLIGRLNAIFKPRAYLFSADWRLRWSQQSPADEPFSYGKIAPAIREAER
ncbi:MAG TPA: hypothetical protein VFJ58_07470 [Armatimonadota bacterium]|nr:hypothetical protein [Armatimonadota bacterium]